MKKLLPALLRGLLCAGALLLFTANTFASHIVAAELRYRWLSGLTYEVSVYLYGDCGPVSRSSFVSLPASKPQVCIFNGSTSVTSINLSISDTALCGTTIAPPCATTTDSTTCTSLSYAIPGIRKFIYTGTVTLPTGSSQWRFIYTGNNGSSTDSTSCPWFSGVTAIAASGRTASITNLISGTTIQLIDTLNTFTGRGHNSNPVLMVEPVPYFCAYAMDCYNPGATDVFDTSVSYGEPLGDSLVFALVTPTDGTISCSVGGVAVYIPSMDSWTTPTVQAMDATHPIQCTSGTTFSFDASNGQLCFEPIIQRSTLVYNIDEYFHDTLTGTMQREMNFYVITCDSIPCSPLKVATAAPRQTTEIYPNPVSTILTISAADKITNITISDMLGRPVLINTYNSSEVNVDVANLPAGVYFIKINGAEIKKMEKL
jgi:hypothetical protein